MPYRLIATDCLLFNPGRGLHNLPTICTFAIRYCFSTPPIRQTNVQRLQKLKSILFRNIHAKYKLVIMDSETFEEKISFRLSRMNVLVILGTLTIGLIFLTTYLIAFTTLKEYIPGYSNPGLARDIYRLSLRADSLEKTLYQKDIYLQNIRHVLLGNTPMKPGKDSVPNKAEYSKLTDRKSIADSLFRLEFENRDNYALYGKPGRDKEAIQRSIASLNFYTPVKGYITSRFDARSGHFGVDIATSANEAVKAILDGTIVHAGWNMETGYVISIQHPGNLVSAYMHNSTLLKKQGDIVRSGEPIAIVGSSGKLSTGIHLHLELWHNGTAVDPEKYIRF